MRVALSLLSNEGPLDFRKEIERLIELEYGQRVDVVFRFLSVCVVGLLLYSYTGTTSTLIWLASFYTAQLAHYLFLKTRSEVCTRRDLLLAGAFFWMVIASFLWQPADLMTSDDPALRIGGAVGFGAVLVYLIHRSDRVLEVMLGEIVVVCLAALWVLHKVLPQVTIVSARLGLIAAVLTLMIYFSLTILTNRRMRLEAELAARRLEQMRKMEAIGQLAGGFAHDFNNILAAIIGNLDLCTVLEAPDERAECVAEARLAASRAAELVRQLLTYARRSPMQIAAHDLGQLLTEAQGIARRLLPASIIQGYSAPPVQLYVAVDRNQFSAALINLVLNARDAMPDGGVLRVATRLVVLTETSLGRGGQERLPGRYAEVSVIDSGLGIAPDILERVTEPFFTTKGVGKGSGLGLSMVEGFAQQSGGALDIESSPEGTTVRLLLPVVPSPDRAPARGAPEPAPAPHG